MLSIGNITINSSLVLSPMAGISDLPFRMINRSFGCEFAFTEMISAGSLSYKNRKTFKLLSMSEGDRPLGIQLLGNDPETLKRALEIAAEYSFDIIDFNAACPSKKVVSRGKGAGLLREPAKLQELLNVIVTHTDTPVTVKIRAGWDSESVNAVEIARRAEDAGVKGLFIHGRTRMQGYRGTVDYNIIRNVKDSISIPLIASGDALTPDLIRRMFDETGCDGVAIARGTFGNPWIFRDTAGYIQNGETPLRPEVNEIVKTMKEHLTSNIAQYGESTGVIRFRKFFRWYLRGFPIKELKARAFRACTRDEMFSLMDKVNYSCSHTNDMSMPPSPDSIPWEPVVSAPRCGRPGSQSSESVK